MWDLACDIKQCYCISDDYVNKADKNDKVERYKLTKFLNVCYPLVLLSFIYLML